MADQGIGTVLSMLAKGDIEGAKVAAGLTQDAIRSAKGGSAANASMAAAGHGHLGLSDLNLTNICLVVGFLVLIVALWKYILKPLFNNIRTAWTNWVHTYLPV